MIGHEVHNLNNWQALESIYTAIIHNKRIAEIRLQTLKKRLEGKSN